MARKYLLSEAPSPRALVRHLLSCDVEFVALLESGPGHAERSRYTIVAWDVLDRYVVWPDDERNVYSDLKRLIRSCAPDVGPIGMDFVVGYISYEACTLIEPHLRDYVHDWGSWPLVELARPKHVVIYDKHLCRVYSNVDLEDLRIEDGDPGDVVLGDVVERVDDKTFMSWVEDSLEMIRSGEIFQIVLSKWMAMSASGDYFTLYERLADVNPSPYMYFVKFEDRHVIGTSPELLVKVVEDRVETHPIAGTRPRGRDEREDVRLEEELIRSEKDRAEHIMLVDLARSDLGRICRIGTVRVTELFVIEKYSHVQHLVSKVEGALERGMDIVDALWATFPAGTVTGAPKPRAMELIFEYERRARGPYAGAIGFANARVGEFAITIRSAFIEKNVVKMQAGAGIVYDSRPELENEEVEHKLRALRVALGMATP